MTITAGDLRKRLQGIPDDTVVQFDGGLTFGDLRRYDDEYVIHFGEMEAELSPVFRRKHPSIIAAFFRPVLQGEKAEIVSVPRL